MEIPMPRELRVVQVMVRLEPSLHDHLIKILHEEAEMASGYLRGLLIKELQRRDLLDDDTVNKLVGSAR